MSQGSKNREGLKVVWDFICPTSVIMSLIMGIILGVPLNEFFKDGAHLGMALSVLKWWFVCFVASLIVQYIINGKNFEIGELKQQLETKNDIIKEKDIQINNNLSLIEGKYGEISEHLKYNKLTTLCRKIVNKFAYVEGIQIHDYVKTPKRNIIHFKIQYYTGWEKEGSNINCLKQKYYEVNTEIYSDFRAIIQYYKFTFDRRIESDVNTLYNLCFNLFSKITQKLSTEELIDSTSEYSTIINLLWEIMFEIKPEIADLENSVRVEVIHRCGIFSSILRNSDSIYNYNKYSENKSQRIYFTFLDVLDNENKSITFILNLNSYQNNELLSLIGDVIDYYEYLSKSFNKTYR